MNIPEEIESMKNNLTKRIKDGSQRFLLRYNGKYVGIFRVQQLGYDKKVIGCIETNPSNDFYIHMGAKLEKTNPINIGK